MTTEIVLKHEFVEFVPEKLEEHTVYISIPYATVSHLCVCGCGHEVVTPLSPTDWQLTFNGESVSLDPSIGNWSFPCRSHYFVRRNRVRWSYEMSAKEIKALRRDDARAKEDYFEEKAQRAAASSAVAEPKPASSSLSGATKRVSKRRKR